MDLLANTALRVRMDELRIALNAIEQTMTDTTPHSDQALLDDAWNMIVEELEELEELFAIDEANQMEDTRGCHACTGCGWCDDAMGYDPSGEI